MGKLTLDPGRYELLICELSEINIANYMEFADTQSSQCCLKSFTSIDSLT